MPLKGLEALAGLLALGRRRALLAGHFDDERTTLNGVDEDEAGLKLGVGRPGAEESNGSTALVLVIFGVDVEEARLAHAGASGVVLDGGDVDDVEAVAVVGLIKVAVDDVLVVVNGAGLSSVVSGVYGLLKRANVEDVRSWLKHC